MKNQVKKTEEIVIPDKMPIHIAFGEKVRSAQFNIVFPDGRGGALTLTKVIGKDWQPIENIKKITLEWI